jgi:HSP20 family protein
MTTLVRWNPFTGIYSLRHAMDTLEDFAPIKVWSRAEPADLTFPTDLMETDDHVVVTAVLPGIKPDEVEIEVTDGILTIKGEVKHEQKTERDNYYSREIRYGTFSRSIQLPTRVNHKNAEAEFENGILTVSLPKAEEVRPQMIKVRPVGKKALVGAGRSST